MEALQSILDILPALSVPTFDTLISALPINTVDVETRYSWLISVLEACQTNQRPDLAEDALLTWPQFLPDLQTSLLPSRLFHLASEDLLFWLIYQLGEDAGFFFKAVASDLINDRDDSGLIQAVICWSPFTPVSVDTLWQLIGLARSLHNTNAVAILGPSYATVAPTAPKPRWLVSDLPEDIPKSPIVSLSNYRQFLAEQQVTIPVDLVLGDVKRQQEQMQRALAGHYSNSYSTLRDFRLHGPINPDLDSDSDPHMFLYQSRDDDDGTFDDPFNGYCDYCYRRINSFRHTIRQPLATGGWSGWYCSIEHMYLDAGCQDCNNLELILQVAELIEVFGIFDADLADSVTRSDTQTSAVEDLPLIL